MRHAGAAAALLCVAAVWGFGAALDGEVLRTLPVAVLGVPGMPHARAFNALGVVVPGLLMLVAVAALRASWPVNAPWSARVGARLLQISALAFALQGVLPLREDLDAGPSRLHALAWTAWWVAAVPGGLLLAAARRDALGTRWSRALCLFAALALPLCVVLAPAVGGAPLAQRVGFALWLGWLALLPYADRLGRRVR